MIYQIQSQASDLDFYPAIRAHSGDAQAIYKVVAGAPCYLSLYHPLRYDPARRRYPLLVLIHGGGWQGRRVFADQLHWAGDHLGFLARYYANQGFFCVSMDYRLMREQGQADGYELIDLYEDCMDAQRYIQAHASVWGIDTQDTTLLGESAGGYLAAAMLTLPNEDTGFFTNAILVNAITDLADEHWGNRIARNSAHPLLLGRDMAEKLTLLSPVQNIRPGVCAALLLHGAQDMVVSPHHSQLFYDRMVACGDSAELDVITGADHAFLLVEYMLEKGQSID
ncbi:MAG: alpha/beta hydrolase, partial [Clostridia bacterium]